MNPEELSQKAVDLANAAQDVAAQAGKLSQDVTSMAVQAVAEQSGHTPFVQLFTVFVLACFIGYMVVWNVTPALHTPLMSVTNAISSIIAIGALVQIAPPGTMGSGRPDELIRWLAFVALVLTAVNMFGGFAVTRRMLAMFRK